MHSGKDLDAFDSLSKRCAELFGRVTLENSGLRLMKSYEGVIIIRCNLDKTNDILVCVALSYPPLVTIDMSGSLKRLRKRADFGKDS